MTKHGAPLLEPRIYDVLQFVTSLYHTMRSPGGIQNALSGARSWLLDHGGSPDALSHPSVKRLCRGGNKVFPHRVLCAPPISPRVLRHLIAFLTTFGTPTLMPIAALLIGYFAMLRQSNLLSPRPGIWGGPHTIRRRDIRPCPQGLRVTLNSSKTIQAPRDAVELLVPKIHDSLLCPVLAWHKASAAVPASGLAPAFLSSADTPLDTPTLTKILRLSLKMIHVPLYDTYTFRSLRRGAAQACQGAGVPLAAIKAQGTWESSAIFSYIPRKAPTAAPLALASYFGRATGTADGDK